ncbi:MAG TPA: HEAT repeat domain-containing protein [Vicinamibacterales bacterium]|nr:HEAT repeat domain-containing protein [Vicinamibacterales bacterium]
MNRETIRWATWVAILVASPALSMPAVTADTQDAFARLADRADEDRVRAEQDRARAEQDRARAEQDRARADQERARADQAYERGRDSIEREQWARAVEQFSNVIGDRAARADAAMYWRSYAFDKLNRQADALTSLAELMKSFPMSRWLSDAKALELQIRQRAGQPISPDAQADEDLKLLAIQGLMDSNPEQALPMLEKLLQGSGSPRLKTRALFVLAQSGSPRAQEVISRIARGGSNPDLQDKAIQYLGMTPSESNRQVLSEVYQSSGDINVKRQVLRAFMLSGDKVRVQNAAMTEKSPELRGEAVRQLGVMGARAELGSLYQKEQTVEVKRQLLRAMGVSGDAAHLIEVTNTETNPELLREAIRQIGVAGGGRTRDELPALYARMKDPTVKTAVIDALFIQNNADALVAMARKETDPTMKRRIVEKLSVMPAPAARNYMLELLEK